MRPLVLWSRLRDLAVVGMPRRLALPILARDGAALPAAPVALTGPIATPQVNRGPLLPALAMAAWTMFPRMPTADLLPSILLVGKRRTSGKSKRMPKPANHGARPCNHVGRRQRAKAMGAVKHMSKK